MQIFSTIILHVIDFTTQFDFLPGAIIFMERTLIQSPSLMIFTRVARPRHSTD
jgi:hypothetical protein